jgi:hypothetical protein
MERWVDAAQRRQKMLRDLLAQIRSIEGFEDFLKPTTFEEVLASATDTPLVYLTPGPTCGFALIVFRGGVFHVVLPLLERRGFTKEATAYLSAYQAFRDGDSTWGEWSEQIERTAKWLGIALGRSLVDQLPAGGPLHIIACGGLDGLPIHAAYLEGEASDRHFLFDSYAISFLPNARALISVRNRSGILSESMLVVAAQGRGTHPMPAALQEAQGIASLFSKSRLLTEGEATSENVIRGLREAGVAHFATHGEAHLSNPLASRLILDGGHYITLEDILRLRVQMRLVVLSSCETYIAGGPVLDEVVSLPSGLVQAGVSGVVSSMWKVPDVATSVFMARFYAFWTRESLEPANALSRARIWMRDTRAVEKVDWLQSAAQMEGSPRHWLTFLSDSYAESGYQPNERSLMADWAPFVFFGI